MALPDTYKQIEYIESSNTQYIKIGNSWNSSYKTEAVLQITGTVDVMFGIRDDIANVHRYGLRGQDGYFKGVTGSQSGISQTTFPLDTNKHNISLYNGTLTIDGNSYSVYNTSNVSFSNGMTIFGYTLGSTSGAASYFRVFSFKVYNGTTLLYDLVPVLRKSDGKPGLYDLVNNVFYTNQGTGEFSYPAQSGKIKKIYVGAKQVRPEEYCYTPTSNTKLYYPFVNSQLDITGNTALGKSLTKQSKGYKYSSGSQDRDISFTTYVGTRFFCFWMYCNTLPTNKYVRVIPTDYGYMHFVPTDSTTSHARNTVYVMGNSSTSPYQNSWYYSGQKTITLGQWNHFAYGIGSDNKYIWVLNGTSMWSGTASGTAFNNTSMMSNLFGGNDAFEITLLDLIGEDRVRTLSEIQTYYNKSKSYYGL